jgi:hypothetical protein
MARTLLVCAVVCLALILPPPAAAQASRTKEYPLDISRQQLTPALEQLNRQTNLHYAYIPESAEEEQTLVGPLKGNYRIDQALTELLRSTELTFEWTGAKMVSIVRRPPAPKPPPPPAKQPRAGLRDKQLVPEQESTEDEILERVVTTWRSRFGASRPPSTVFRRTCSASSRGTGAVNVTVTGSIGRQPLRALLRLHSTLAVNAGRLRNASR